MNIDKLSEAWLFERHSKQTVKRWLNQLRYFYFTRAWGGFAQDGDIFEVGFTFQSKQDLLFKMQQLGVTLNVIPDDFPRAVMGKRYSHEEYQKFKSEIRQFPDLEQPGHFTLCDHKVFIWVNDHAIRISVSGTGDGNLYEVSDDDFKVCIDLEKFFDTLNWTGFIDRSREQSVCCISRTKYPGLYDHS